jgi:peptide/nickel transport system substrate-binding protein
MNPRTSRGLAIFVALVAILAAAGVYYAGAQSARTSSTSTANCPTTSSNPILFDSPEASDSVDPTVTATVPGWSIDQNIYQTLVMYNGSSETSFDGELAENWSQSSNGLHWNFTLWPGIHFSNGDPLNAYVLWYSFYRSLLVDQPNAYLVEENFYAPGVSYYSNISAIDDSNASLNATLNTFTSVATVENPSSATLIAMEASNQSFRIINNLTIQLNLGFGYLDLPVDEGGVGTVSYAFLLDQVATPAFAAVDPVWIHDHGGVALGLGNTYSSTNAMGSGPYTLKYYSESGGWELVPSTNYWAANTTAKEQPWNTLIQPALHSIQVNVQPDPAVLVSNLQTGTIASGDFGYVGPSTLTAIANNACITVKAAPVVYGSTEGAWWIYMDQNTPPFNNLSVRAAVVHAINYAQVITEAFGSATGASQWVGPVPPGYPDYNPDNLTPYQFDLNLAWQEMNASPYPYNPATGKGGYPGTLNFEYINDGDFPVVALLLGSDLAKIGLHLNLEGMSYDQLIIEQAYDLNTGLCTSTESTNGGPYPIGMDFYSADYVAPDDATQLDALSYGEYNECQSEYANATMDQLVLDAAGQLNATLRAQEYANQTELMYQNYTNAWLVVPTFYQVYNIHLTGLVSNAMGSSIPASFEYNTYTVT